MKPKYAFLSNTRYALNGVKVLLLREKSFQIECIIIFPALILNFFLPLSILEHLFLAFTLFLILIAEAINTAIEASVDLITNDFHEQAKIAKDCGATAVFFSIAFALMSWSIFLIKILLYT